MPWPSSPSKANPPPKSRRVASNSPATPPPAFLRVKVKPAAGFPDLNLALFCSIKSHINGSLSGLKQNESHYPCCGLRHTFVSAHAYATQTVAARRGQADGRVRAR